MPPSYGEAIEQDLGVKVEVERRHIGGVLTRDSLLTRLQKNEQLREAVGGAQIVTFS